MNDDLNESAEADEEMRRGMEALVYLLIYSVVIVSCISVIVMVL